MQPSSTSASSPTSVVLPENPEASLEKEETTSLIALKIDATSVSRRTQSSATVSALPIVSPILSRHAKKLDRSSGVNAASPSTRQSHCSDAVLVTPLPLVENAAPSTTIDFNTTGSRGGSRNKKVQWKEGRYLAEFCDEASRGDNSKKFLTFDVKKKPQASILRNKRKTLVALAPPDSKVSWAGSKALQRRCLERRIHWRRRQKGSITSSTASKKCQHRPASPQSAYEIRHRLRQMEEKIRIAAQTELELLDRAMAVQNFRSVLTSKYEKQSQRLVGKDLTFVPAALPPMLPMKKQRSTSPISQSLPVQKHSPPKKRKTSNVTEDEPTNASR